MPWMIVKGGYISVETMWYITLSKDGSYLWSPLKHKGLQFNSKEEAIQVTKRMHDVFRIEEFND